MRDGTTIPIVDSRYRLERKLGAGGHGEAWLATDVRLRRPVVLKRLIDPGAVRGESTKIRIARAEREARAAGGLKHPGIVTVFDQFPDSDGLPWIVMEYVDGPSLREALVSGPLPVGEVARIGGQIASALATAHAAGVVHRDIKPANILLAEGQAVVADFGIASVPDEIALTATGTALGTPEFMAPEHLGGEASAASDMWSLGATLYWAVEGRPPFRGDSILQVVAAIGRGVAEPMRLAGPLEPFIRDLMQFRASDRPTATAAADVLRGLVENSGRPTAGVTAIDRLLAEAAKERDTGSCEKGEDLYWTALDLAIRDGARPQQGWAWDGIGSCRWRADDPETAMRFFTRAAQIADETGDKLLEAWSLHNFGAYRRKRGEFAAAKDFFARTLTLATEREFTGALGWTYHHLAEIAAEEGDARQEQDHYAAAARVGLDGGADELAGWSLFNVARCAERADRLGEAREHYAQALEIGSRIRNRWMIEQSSDALRRLTPPG
ncbi:MAG: serine/threonine protein kinase [Streptomycetaceae bacterium]|jgi:hypothetical protein|nr:serine/threonine protein kinase [Streptomycetaceae bacterium]NUS57375.1 serine/threonine protein kinase [Streptomycetaceae bacterium]